MVKKDGILDRGVVPHRAQRSLTRGKSEGQGRGCTGRSPGKGERRPEGGPLPLSTVWALPGSNKD